MQKFKITFFVVMLCIIFLPGTSPVFPQDQPITTSADSVPDGTLRRIRVPILMYHYVSPLPSDADDIRIGLTVEPQIFREHIAYLQNEGYSTISLYQLYNALVYGAELPAKPIVLTFDDGHIDHYTNVFPILQEYGFTGTFFIITGKADVNEAGYMAWSQINEMASAGMSMEPHSKRHFDLRNRDFDFLVYEVVGSHESLQSHTGQNAEIFAYPAGRYDDATLSLMETTAIRIAVTTEFGAYHTTSDRLLMTRMRVSGNMSVAGLAGLINSDP